MVEIMTVEIRAMKKIKIYGRSSLIISRRFNVLMTNIWQRYTPKEYFDKAAITCFFLSEKERFAQAFWMNINNEHDESMVVGKRYSKY